MKIETTAYSFGFRGITIVEHRMEKNMENEMAITVYDCPV